MNLDFAKVCGKHSAVYEAYYKQIDPNGSGAIEAMTAAKFLKKSGLSDVVLSRVWDMSDPNGKGFLDKPGFFVALKLVSLAQAGQVSNMNNIYVETVNPPKVGDIPKTMPSRIQTVPVSSGGVANADWSISVIDRLKYEQLFESLKPVNGMLPGNKVKGVLMESKLPMDTLGVIWDLADQDKDGNLDKHEFLVAMHLVYQTLQKRTVPNVLPPELRKPGTGAPPPKPAPPAVVPMPRAPSGEGFGDNGFVANFPKDIAPPPTIPPLPVAVPPMTRIPPVGAVAPQPLIQTDPLIPIGAPPSVTANADWVVTPAELQRFEVMFRDSDRDKDGLVSGLEVKEVFIQSGVPQKCLAHIWALCDTNQSGKLTVDQFALAMWMVERKQKGLEPPQVLTANMVPPSMRSIMSGVDLQTQEPKPTYSNPELEMISKEIEELARERRVLETEIAQKEADVRIKNGEVRSLQSELDTLSATLKQLENQRGEAQKRLDDLQAQGNDYQAMLANFNLEISQTRNQVNKIREQCHKQEETINEQEGELNAKRSELQKLKDEEDSLQKEYDDNNRELTKLTKHLQNTQLQISSVRSMVTQLMETQRQMTDALLICRAAIDNQNAELVSEYQLKIEPDFDDAHKTLEKEVEPPKDDPFGEGNTNTAVGIGNNMKQGINGFDSDPFGGKQQESNSGFDESFNTNAGFNSGFDAFGGSSSFGHQNQDPFGSDAFGANKVNAVTPEPGKDDFGSDPFAALHAPTGQGQVLSPNTQKSGPPPRPESPSPALPPKKSKVPPPRPAPPRPGQGPARSTQPSTDAFGTTTSSGFADFGEFDNKLSNIPTTRSSLNAMSGALIDNLGLFDTATNTSSTATLTSSTLPFALSINAPNTSTINTSTDVSLNTTTTITPTPTSTTANNQLSRSNTPLQRAASIFDTFTTSNNNSVFDALAADVSSSAGHNNSITPKPIVSGPTDFKDDPFKDYRYEDPFNIKDPFADDGNDDDVFAHPGKVFKEDFSSEDEHTNLKTKMDAPLNNDVLQKFDAFNLNPSPVPSHHSTNSASKQSLSNTPIPLTASGNSASGGLFDAFADFDTFSTKSTTKTTADQKQKTTSTRNNNNNKNELNDSFFDAFTDNFETNKNNTLNKTETKQANQLSSAFDAFSSTTTQNAVSPDPKFFDAFDDNNFEDDFSNNKSKADNNNINSIFNNAINKPKDEQNKTSLDNFAKFDAFEAHNFSSDFSTALNNSINLKSSETTTKVSNPIEKVQNATTLAKANNQSVAVAGNADAAKLAEKFVADYSKPESFDTDLEEALKRSMLDN